MIGIFGRWRGIFLAAVVAWSQFVFSDVIAFASPSSIVVGSQNAFSPGSSKAVTIQQNLDNALVACRTPGERVSKAPL
jgi:hypothetical protein